MNVLKIKEKETRYLMTIDDDINDYCDNEFILNGDEIRKAPASDDDPIFINIINHDNVTTYVRLSDSEIEHNNNIETANIWTKIKK